MTMQRYYKYSVEVSDNFDVNCPKIFEEQKVSMQSPSLPSNCCINNRQFSLPLAALSSSVEVKDGVCEVCTDFNAIILANVLCVSISIA